MQRRLYLRNGRNSRGRWSGQCQGDGFGIRDVVQQTVAPSFVRGIHSRPQTKLKRWPSAVSRTLLPPFQPANRLTAWRSMVFDAAKQSRTLFNIVGNLARQSHVSFISAPLTMEKHVRPYPADALFTAIDRRCRALSRPINKNPISLEGEILNRSHLDYEFPQIFVERG